LHASPQAKTTGSQPYGRSQANVPPLTQPDHLALLAKAAGRNATERGELVCAYVHDLLPEELHGVIRLEVKGDGAKPAKQAPSEKSLLPATALAALTELQTLSVRSAKARTRMQWFTEILGEIHHA